MSRIRPLTEADREDILSVGSALLRQLASAARRPILVGTWAAADWAIRFYESHGFRREPRQRAAELLRAYWDIPERQIETSVVLSKCS